MSNILLFTWLLSNHRIDALLATQNVIIGERSHAWQFSGCESTYIYKNELRIRVRNYGDEFFSQWYARVVGVQNPVVWMHDYYGAARRPDATSWCAEKALVVLGSSN